MIDDDEREFCQICLEKYDRSIKLPKKMPCCKNTICLKCLQNIYEVNKISQCPICRCDKNVIPVLLLTDLSIFEGEINCPFCKKCVVKSELYYSFSNDSVRCIHCQQNEMTLVEYVTMMMDDLSIFLKDYQKISNTCLLDRLAASIQLQLDTLFATMKESVMQKFKARIALEINEKLGFDLEKDVIKFKDTIDKLNGYLNNMKVFVTESGVKRVTIPTLMSDLKNFFFSKEDVVQQSIPYDKIEKYIFNSNSLIKLKKEIGLDEVNEFMVNIFDTEFSEKKLFYKTGIGYYDNYYDQLLNRQEKKKSSSKSCIAMEEMKSIGFDKEEHQNDYLITSNDSLLVKEEGQKEGKVDLTLDFLMKPAEFDSNTNNGQQGTPGFGDAKGKEEDAIDRLYSKVKEFYQPNNSSLNTELKKN